MKRMLPSLAVVSLAALAAWAVPIPDNCKINGFAVGTQAYSFHGYNAKGFKGFSVMESIEKTAEAGCKVIEFYPGQSLSPEEPTVKFNHNSPDDVFAKVVAKLKKHHVRAVNYGVVGGKDEAEWRQIFEFAKKLGLYGITTEDVKNIDIIEKLVKEFDIAVGYHEHPRRENNPDYKVWDPNYILELVKNRDPRIGSCADIGHWATSGLKPLDCVKILRGHIISCHFKDRPAIGPGNHDVPFGKGISDIKGILDELKSQGFKGNISIEYEANWENNVPEIKECIDFVRSYGK
jgi:sugar phosphate isomerase/epimerase